MAARSSRSPSSSSSSSSSGSSSSSRSSRRSRSHERTKLKQRRYLSRTDDIAANKRSRSSDSRGDHHFHRRRKIDRRSRSRDKDRENNEKHRRDDNRRRTSGSLRTISKSKSRSRSRSRSSPPNRRPHKSSFSPDRHRHRTRERGSQLHNVSASEKEPHVNNDSPPRAQEKGNVKSPTLSSRHPYPDQERTAAGEEDADRGSDKPLESTSHPSRTVHVLTKDNSRSGRTGGVYIPPFKLAQMRANDKNLQDKSSQEYQRMTWDALRKSINGLINKVNVTNIVNLLPELFHENLVRGRGLLVRSIMKAQLASPGFTHIYAALVAVLNTKMPENGELLLKRVIHRFRRALKRGDKVVSIALVRFIAHLVNQQVVHELLALEVLTLLLTAPTDDSVEVAVNFTKECGQMLHELCPEGLRAIFERFRGILHEGEIDKRVQYTIEGLFSIRKGKFVDYPAVHEGLDLVEASDQITHEMGLDEEDLDIEEKLDIFRYDPDFEKNERMWHEIRKELLGEDSEDEENDDDDDGADGEEEEEEDDDDDDDHEKANDKMQIHDFSEQDVVNLRRTIYLTIMSSVSHEECAHKLLRLNIRPGQESEICAMLIECCSQERTYLRYVGLY
jgi:pre-mRNA-splicing factor CWC22